MTRGEPDVPIANLKQGDDRSRAIAALLPATRRRERPGAPQPHIVPEEGRRGPAAASSGAVTGIGPSLRAAHRQRWSQRRNLRASSTG